MHRYKPWVLCDADDTLIGATLRGEIVSTTAIYGHVIELFVKAMTGFGFSASEALSAQRDADVLLCRQVGFSKMWRFPMSFRLAYREMCRRDGREYNQWMAQRMQSIGHQVFDFAAVPLPGALEVLETLREYYRIAIVTKGDAEHQHKKLMQAGCCADDRPIIVMGYKSKKEWWQKVVRPLRMSEDDRRYGWAVGDSIKSDINPPLALGFSAVHINTGGSWVFEKAQYAAVSADAKLHVVSTISEVLQHISCPS